MSARQREYFRLRLMRWKEELLKESSNTLHSLQQDSLQTHDIADRAAAETDRAVELRASATLTHPVLRTRDRERKLIQKIDGALGRINDGSYGFCEETGEPIGVRRLEARPIATLSLEAQERHERMERIYRDD